MDKSRTEEIQRSLTELEELGEEFQYPVTELRGEVFIGCGHHDLDQFSAIWRGEITSALEKTSHSFCSPALTSALVFKAGNSLCYHRSAASP